MKLRAPAMTEAEWQQQVIDLARLSGWQVNHHRPTPAGRGRTRYTTATTVTGWPDLTLWRPGALLFRELKTDTGRLSPDQRQVLAELEAAGADVGVWRPADWPEITQTLRAPAGPRPDQGELMPPTAVRLTPARLRALEQLINNRTARVSNRTSPGTVYWQSAEWLVEHGLADPVDRETLAITDAGRQAWEAR